MKRMISIVCSVVLLFSMLSVITVPMATFAEDDTESSLGYAIYQASRYAGEFQSIFGDPKSSYAYNYYTGLRQDTGFMTTVRAWEGVHIVTDPVYSAQSGELHKKDLYKLAIFDLFDANNSVDPLINDQEGYVMELVGSVAEQTGENAKNLAAITDTSDLADVIKGTSYINKMADAAGVITRILNASANMADAINAAASYQVIADRRDGTKQVLEAIAQLPDGSLGEFFTAYELSELRLAATECVAHFDGAYNNVLERMLVAGTEPYTAGTIKAASELAIGIAWDLITAVIPGVNGVMAALKGVRFLGNAAFNLDDKGKAFYLFNCTVVDVDCKSQVADTVNGGIVFEEVEIITGVNQVGDDLYYVNSDGTYKTGKFWVTATGANGLVDAGYVYTDETGRFYNNEFVNVDGVTYYMEKGQPTKTTGVREIDGNLYSINHKGQVNIGKFWVTAAGTNGLITVGYVYTDDAGRIYDNEFVALEDGYTYYMLGGRPDKTGGGIRDVNGALYYVSWKGILQTGTVYVSNPNGYSVKGTHYTDENGRFYNDEFVTMDGKLYYMTNGRIFTNGGGVEQIGDGLYYISWKGEVQVGTIYVSNPNDLTVKGTHYTDENGRFLDEAFTTATDGKMYYVVDGRAYTQKGVLELDEKYYYVSYNNSIVVSGKVKITADNQNGTELPVGIYYTDANGCIIL